MRERLLDMERRLKPVRGLAMGFLFVALILSADSLGWWPVAVCAVAALGFYLADRIAQHARRPEYAIASAWVFSELLIAFAVGFSGGAESAAVSWLAIPVVTLSARFNLRGVIAGVTLAAVLMATVTVGIDPGLLASKPEFLIEPLALLFAIACLSTALMRSDIDHRTDAVIDGLTGMLNRRALAARVAELTAQSRLSGDPIGVIIGDLDHFKRVNDEHGHAVGDAALVDVAYTLRKELRAFDLAYRIGGEEFLVLLPGGSRDQTAALAEHLRAAIERTPAGGLSLTMSLGVASSEGGTFDYDQVLAMADQALYEAKDEGRNRVAVAGSGAGRPAALLPS